MKGLDYENAGGKKNWRACNRHVANFGVRPLSFGEGCRPYLPPSSPFSLLPCGTKIFRVIFMPRLRQRIQVNVPFPQVIRPLDPRPFPRQVPVARPDSHALDVQYVPFAAHIFLPSPCSRSAYLLMTIVAVSHSAPGVHWYREGCG
jgi:hypothetical protein